MEIIMMVIIAFMAALGLANLLLEWVHNAPQRRQNRRYDRAIKMGLKIRTW